MGDNGRWCLLERTYRARTMNGPFLAVCRHLRNQVFMKNTWRERPHASGTASSQKCPVVPSTGSHFRENVVRGQRKPWPYTATSSEEWPMNMPGIEFLRDRKGRRKAVLIDLKKHRQLWEDLYDPSPFASRRAS